LLKNKTFAIGSHKFVVKLLNEVIFAINNGILKNLRLTAITQITNQRKMFLENCLKEGGHLQNM